jgi:hypothetical protein
VPALTVPEQLVQGAEPTITDSEVTVPSPHPLWIVPHPVSHPVLHPVLQAGAGAGAGAQLETAAPEHFALRRLPSLLSIPPPLQSLATAPLQAAFFECKRESKPPRAPPQPLSPPQPAIATDPNPAATNATAVKTTTRN